MYREHKWYIIGVLCLCFSCCVAYMISITILNIGVKRLEEENRLQRIEINRLIHKDDPQPECDLWTL